MANSGSNSPLFSKKLESQSPKVNLNDVQESLKVMRQKRLSRLSTFVAEQSRLFEARSQSEERESDKHHTVNRLSGDNYLKSSFHPISEESDVQQSQSVSAQKSHTKVTTVVKEKLNQDDDNVKSSPKRNFLSKFNCAANQRNITSSSSEDEVVEGDNSHSEGKLIGNNDGRQSEPVKLSENSEINTVQKLSQRKPIYFSDEFVIDAISIQKPSASLPSANSRSIYASQQQNFVPGLKTVSSSDNLSVNEPSSLASVKKQLQSNISTSSLPSNFIEAKQALEKVGAKSSEHKFKLIKPSENLRSKNELTSIDPMKKLYQSLKEQKTEATEKKIFVQYVELPNVPIKPKSASVASVKKELENKVTSSPFISGVHGVKQQTIQASSQSPGGRVPEEHEQASVKKDLENKVTSSPLLSGVHGVKKQTIQASSQSPGGRVPEEHEHASVKKELENKVTSSPLLSGVHDAKQQTIQASSQSPSGRVTEEYEPASMIPVAKQLQNTVSSSSSSFKQEKSNFGVNKTDEFKIRYSKNLESISVKDIQKKVTNLSKEEKILKKLQMNYSTVDKLLKSDDDCQIDSDEMEDFKNTLVDAKDLLLSYELKLKELDQKLPLRKLDNIWKILEDLKKQIDGFRGLRRDSLFADLLNRLRYCEDELSLVSNSCRKKQEIFEYLKLCLILLEDKAHINEMILRDLFNDLVEIISKRRIKETFL